MNRRRLLTALAAFFALPRPQAVGEAYATAPEVTRILTGWHPAAAPLRSYPAGGFVWSGWIPGTPATLDFARKARDTYILAVARRPVRAGDAVKLIHCDGTLYAERTSSPT